MKNIDARGLSCPEPVIKTQNAVKSGDKSLEIVVDTNIAKENIVRFLESENFKVEVLESGSDITIKANK
ncbi:sulfurtransferase TusA family protein [Lagierella sp.]|uniref:sulfurtransferase TusA family protein n=1 Tax=Lagierella sp. TaxID=2849657 RepID=UPI00261D4521|nr:sulfurtransferase TusA family protein [Lagierella sp.]